MNTLRVQKSRFVSDQEDEAALSKTYVPPVYEIIGEKESNKKEGIEMKKARLQMINDTIKKLQVEACELDPKRTGKKSNIQLSDQLYRLEDLAYRLKLVKYITVYLVEWGENVAGVFKPDDPNMNVEMKAYQEEYLKENFARFIEILGKSTEDMEKFQSTVMDIRQKIAQAWDDKEDGKNDSSQS